MRVRVRENTYLRDGYVTNKLVLDLGNLMLKDLTDEFIEGLQDRWKAAGLSNKTINNL